MKEAIIQIFKLNNMLVNGMLGKMGESDTLARTGDSNTIAWIVGHIIKSRGSALKLFHKDYRALENENDYARGVKKDNSAKIDPQKAVKEFRRRGDEIESALADVNDNFLNQKIDYQLPVVGDTVADAILFTGWHESFHIGQIDLILVALGKGGVK